MNKDFIYSENTEAFIKNVFYKNAFFKLAFLSLLILLVSCDKEGIRLLKEGKTFDYKIIRTIGKKSKQLGHLYLSKDYRALFSFAPDQLTIKWKYDLIDDEVEENTLAEDQYHRFSIHPPRKSFLKFTEVTPYPAIDLPPKVGNRTEITKFIEKYIDFKDGFLNGKTLKQELSVVKVLDTTINNIPYKNCYYSIGRNLNFIEELGKYQIETWFVEGNGFVLIRWRTPEQVVYNLELGY